MLFGAFAVAGAHTHEREEVIHSFEPTVCLFAVRYEDTNEMLAKAKVALPEWNAEALLQYRQAGWSLKQLIE